jgi:predicted transcriptional regulator
MTDIRTAMSGVLDEWELDNQQQEKQVQTTQEKPYFSVTNNVTRATFEYVKNNPVCASGEVSRALEQRGYKPSSVGSLLTQFVKKGLCTRDAQNRYSVAVSEYVPMKAPKKLKAAQVIQKAKATRGEGIAALSPQPTVKLVWDADTVINNIGLKQAHALYLELGKYFGG